MQFFFHIFDFLLGEIITYLLERHTKSQPTIHKIILHLLYISKRILLQTVRSWNPILDLPWGFLGNDLISEGSAHNRHVWNSESNHVMSLITNLEAQHEGNHREC